MRNLFNLDRVIRLSVFLKTTEIHSMFKLVISQRGLLKDGPSIKVILKTPKYKRLNIGFCVRSTFLTHCGPVTQICVFTLQLCKTDDANLRF